MKDPNPGNYAYNVNGQPRSLPDGVSELEWDHYRADIYALHDYDPFGMLLAWRSWESEAVRHGFNGKERDDDWHGAGDSYDFGARMYDSRGCRWLSTDPLAELRAWVSPYNFVQNNPLVRVDPSGMLDGWVKKASGSYIWDDNVTDQASTYLNHGAGALYIPVGHQYVNNENRQVTLLNYGSFMSGNRFYDNQTKKYYEGIDVLMRLSEVITTDSDPHSEDVKNYVFEIVSALAMANGSIAPDGVTIGFGLGYVAGAGGSTSINYNVVREPSGLVSMFTIEQGIGLGFDVDATVSMSATWYTGEQHNVNARSMLTGLNVYGNVGFSDGVKGGYTTAFSVYADEYGHYYNTVGFEGGLGLPVGPLPMNASFGLRLGIPLERGWKSKMDRNPITNTPYPNR